MSFADFYRRTWGFDPFPWQGRLALQVAEGRWPDTLTLPTSAGKTAVVDVWLWAHAQRIPNTPRRLYYVIDRRVLVDAVAEHARRVVQSAGIETTLVTLRGGLGSASDDWMLDPSRPAFISTTVDQFGSRLLCRAYGVGRYSAPLHAGLSANDALVVIDEAHLAEPLRQTLDAVARLRERAQIHLPLPWRVLTMTATPLAGGDSIELDETDRMHPLLSRRLAASKLARLARDGGNLADTLAAEALRHRELGAAVVGVIANTVDIARAVHDTLARRADALLLIGRVRPFDRDGLATELMRYAGTGTRQGGRAPIFVVATQTIEVGVDLDFDALVTEVAPVAALRQRFGRLDRLGELALTRATVVYSAEANLPYGRASLQAAWKWLQASQKTAKGEGKVVDFGIGALPAPPPETTPLAPRLLPRDVELLFDPDVDIDVSPYLHGERRELDVHIAWRACLDALPEDEWSDAVADAPPLGPELLSVPLYAFRAWQGGHSAPVGDIEGGATPEHMPRALDARPVMRWDGENADFIAPEQLRTGDVIVIPSSDGGYDRFGWNPASTDIVPDLLAEGKLSSKAWRGDNARTRHAIGLAEHLKGVGDKALAIAHACGLPADLAEAVAEAARLHDLGKNDPRYQLMLGAEAGTLLAKSGPHEVQVSRQLAGLPRGWRHELASLAQRPDLAPLVRYLVGSHHGRGRPWLPVSPDPPLWHKATGAEWPALVAVLRDEYGAWGLAYLEALVRLADWARSAEEQQQREAMRQESQIRVA